ncbi:MAG: cell surface protein SprA [Candidatus Eisenbacteria bacterium]
MSLALTLPLVGLLIGLPGIPGFSKLPKLRLPRKAVVDTIPPVWKPYSLLALEDEFVFAALPPIGPRGARLKITNDPRRLQISVDPDSGTVSAVPEMGEVALGEAARVPFAQYSRDLARQNFRKVWADRSRQSVNTLAGQVVAPQRGGMSFALPSPLPKRVQSLLGPGGPAISVSGSENIKLAGTSEWTNQQTGLLGQRRSLFPALDMQQDLDIRLEGQLSDRVKVNLLQNSATQIPLTNKIAINYRGDEDDLVQALDLGNTNLALPGTQYVSYSGRNEGLFGMKATTRLGPLDFTLLASKQEGKSERASYAGGSSRQQQTLNDYDYVRGAYFFLYDPNFETQEIDESSIRVYLDDGNNYATRVNAVRGRAFVDPRTAKLDSLRGDPPTPSVRGIFTLLTQGAENDYEILNDVYGPRYKVIRLRRAVTGEQQRLAVTYGYRPVSGGQAVGAVLPMGGADPLDTDGATARTMKLLRAPLNLLPAGGDGNFDPSAPFAPTRELELRNFYQLAGQRIDPKSFSLVIRRGVDDPPVTFRTIGGEPVPYFEILGFDTFDESHGSPEYRRHDGKVDGTLPSSTSRLFVDYQNGTLFFFDLRPFAPRIADDPGYAPRPFERFLSTILFRRDSLVGPPDSTNSRNRAIYDKRNPLRSIDSQYYIDLDFTAARAGNEINLGRTNIIEGSETVTKNGQRLERDRDYTIDYDLGRVTLKGQLGATDQLNVDYGFAPLFQQTGRTLLGSAFRLDGRDKRLGGAFMYESKGAQDLRPRLGEEPSRVLIGDLNGEWKARPAFLTRWIDALPGVRTTAPSEFSLSAEMGASFPNPNTFNEVFIDDMEGVRDAVSLVMTPERWHWSSMPSRKDAITLIADSIQAFQRNAEVHWFTPLNAVKERELKPNLTDAQGAQNPRQTLAISVPRRPPGAAAGDSLWAGLTYVLDPVGLDLSRAQFIELWVNDFRDTQKVPRTPGGAVRLHVDLGVVSEDQRRSPAIAANRILDSEDLPPRDNQLTVTENNNEDTGLDGRTDASEPGDASLITSNAASDPGGDDFRPPEVDSSDPRRNLNPDRWRFINGTEGNKNSLPIPDTEDLNLNNSLDLQEDYFEYTIDLASSPYLSDTVYAPGRTFSNNGDPIPADNGWRRYRIPLTDTLRVKFGSPDLTLARHVRVWLEGITTPDSVVSPVIGEKRPLIMLGGMEIVGSRWLVNDLTPAQVDSGTTVTLNSVNNVDNSDVYTPPFDPGSTRNGAQDLARREQSLALEFTRLLPGDSLEAYKTFSLDENYSRYGTLRFWVAGFEIPGYDPATGNLSYFVRFASDERGINYYEYRAPVPRSSSPGAIQWADVQLKLTELSNLKLIPGFSSDPVPYRAGRGAPGETLIVKGRPSFTRLRRISFGLLNLDPAVVYPSGRVWLDEMRATDVARDRGSAQRLAVSGRMANLFNYGVTYNARDEDFLMVGETRGSGNRSSSYTATAGIDLHRFFEGTGIVLPVTLNLSGNRAQPRYTAGDDVVRTGALAEASESRSASRSYSVSYTRTWSERSNPLLRHTLGGISANLSQTRTEYRNPASVDTARSLAAGVGYSISPRKLLPVSLPGTRARFWPLPERFYWNYSIATRSSRTYDRLRDASGSLVLRNATAGRTASIDFGADSRPLDLLHHRFQARRNLTLPEPLREQIGFINLGRVVQWNQSMDSRYSVNRGRWLKPQLSWNASYFQNNGPELSSDLSVRAVNNAETFNVGWSLPFDQLGQRTRSVRRDTLQKAPPAWQGWLSRLGALSLDAGVTRSSNYTRLAGTPRLAYLIGLSNDPGLEADSTGPVQARFGNAVTQNQDWRTGARTRLSLGRGATIQTRGDLTMRRSAYNTLVNRVRRVQFPDLDVDYGKLPEVIGLKRLFGNPKMRTAYSRSRTTEFSNSETPTNISTSREWRPLVGLTGDFRNGTRAEFRVQHRATEAEYRQVGNSITSDANTDVDLSLNRAYTRGQKVAFLGKQSTVKTNITLGLTAAYSRRKSGTRQAGIDRPFNPVAEDRLNVNARGSYGFSTNVTGNAELGFSQNRDLQRDIVRRSIRIELRAQFTF